MVLATLALAEGKRSVQEETVVYIYEEFLVQMTQPTGKAVMLVNTQKGSAVLVKNSRKSWSAREQCDATKGVTAGLQRSTTQCKTRSEKNIRLLCQ